MKEQMLNVIRFSVMLKIQRYFTTFINVIYKLKLTEIYKCLKMIVHYFMLVIELSTVNIFNLIVKFNQILYKVCLKVNHFSWI